MNGVSHWGLPGCFLQLVKPGAGNFIFMVVTRKRFARTRHCWRLHFIGISFPERICQPDDAVASSKHYLKGHGVVLP